MTAFPNGYFLCGKGLEKMMNWKYTVSPHYPWYGSWNTCGYRYSNLLNSEPIPKFSLKTRSDCGWVGWEGNSEAHRGLRQSCTASVSLRKPSRHDHSSAGSWREDFCFCRFSNLYMLNSWIMWAHLFFKNGVFACRCLPHFMRGMQHGRWPLTGVSYPDVSLSVWSSFFCWHTAV